MLVLLHGTSYPNETLCHYSIDKSRSNTREVMGPAKTIIVLARSHVLTNTIVSQEDTLECREKFQPIDQLQYIVKHIRFVNK